MDDVYRALDRNMPLYVRWLQALCQFRSIAANHDSEMQRCAEWIAQTCRDIGAVSATVITTAGAPVVVVQFGTRGPRVLSYTHYDVQPVEQPDDWIAPPFEGRVLEQGGRDMLVARGAADTKGHVVSRLAAIHAYLEARRELPVRVTFIIEGEEEVGSPNLASFVSSYPEYVEADVAIWESGLITPDGRPVIYLGMKGISYFEIALETAKRGIHSSAASIAFNAAEWMVYALHRLKDERGRVQIPRFYDDVVPIGDADRAVLTDVEIDPRYALEVTGAQAYPYGLEGQALAEALFLHPTLNLCSVHAGPSGEGTKTVVPPVAHAALDCRLVPNQDPEAIIAWIQRSFGWFKGAKATRSFEISRAISLRPYRTPVDHPFATLVADAARAASGAEPCIWPMHPASGPMALLLEANQVPVASFGAQNARSHVHGRDENILLDHFKTATRIFAAVIDRLP